MALPIGRKAGDDVIQAQSLGTTTTAGVSAALTGLVGAILSLLPQFSSVDVPVRLQVAGVLVVGLAIIGWGIATAGDALARAYATAHVVDQGDGSEAKKPALPAAVERLAEAYENGKFGIPGNQNDGSDAKSPAMAQALIRVAEAYENGAFGISGIQHDGSDARTPALSSAVIRLAEAHENATFGISGIQHDGSDAKKPAIATAIEGLNPQPRPSADGRFIQAPPGLTYSVDQESFAVAALEFSPDGVVRLMFFDAEGKPHLSEPLRMAVADASA